MHTITTKYYRIKQDVAADIVAAIEAWSLVGEHHCGVIKDSTQTVIAVQQWWDDRDPPALYRDYTVDFLAEFSTHVTEIAE